MPKLPNPLETPRPTPRLGGGSIPTLQQQGPTGASGEALSRTSRMVFEWASEEVERTDTLRAEAALNKLREKQLDMTFNEQDGYTRRRSEQAATTDMVKEYGGRFDNEVESIAGTLGSPRQVEKFRQRAEIASQQFREGVLRHQLAESDQYAKDTYLSTAEIEERFVTSNFDKPEEVQLSIARIENAVQDMAERFGWDQNRAEAERLKRVGALHESVLKQAIATRNWEYGKAWFDAHRQDIELETAKAFERALGDAQQKGLFDDYMGTFIEYRDSPRALEQLAVEIGKNTGFDEAKKNMLLGRIESRIDTLTTRAERQQDRTEREVERALKTLDQVILAGFEVPPEQLAPVMEAARGNPYLENLVARTIATSDATRKFRLAPPAVQERMLMEFEQQARKNPGKFDVTALSKLRTIYDNQQREIKENPVAFAVRQGMVEADTPMTKPIDLSDPGKIDTLPQRMVLARAMNHEYGAPQKPLTKEEADLAIAVVSKLDAEGKRKYMGDLWSASQGDTEAYAAVLGQIAKGDPLFAHAGIAAKRRGDNGLGERAARYILRGQHILHGKTPDGNKAVNMELPSDRALREEYDSQVGDAFAGKPAAHGAFFATAKAIYAAMTADAGEDPMELDGGRWEEAINLATGGIGSYNGTNIILPWGKSEDEFEDGVRDRLLLLAKQQRLGSEFQVSTLQDLPMRAIGDGRYVFLQGDDVVLERGEAGKPPKPIVIDFNMQILSGDITHQQAPVLAEPEDVTP